MNLYIEKNVDDRGNGHPVPIPVRVRTKENRYFFLVPHSHLFLVAWTLIQQGTYIGTLYSMTGGLCQSHIGIMVDLMAYSLDLSAVLF
jgi:hypothetical protein